MRRATTRVRRSPVGTMPEVNSRQVTRENLQRVADWCGGEAQKGAKGYYIRLPHDSSPRHYAFVGDWIVLINGRYVAMNDDRYKTRFLPDVKSVPEDVSLVTGSNIFDNFYAPLDSGEGAWHRGPSVDPKDQIRGSGR